MRSTSSSSSRSRSTKLTTGGWPGSTSDSESLLVASLKSSLFFIFFVEPEVMLTAPTRSTCSPNIAFKVAAGYQVILCDDGYQQQLSNKIHHISGTPDTIALFEFTLPIKICTWMHTSCIVYYSIIGIFEDHQR